jgi:hypothetical protein
MRRRAAGRDGSGNDPGTVLPPLRAHAFQESPPPSRRPGMAGSLRQDPTRLGKSAEPLAQEAARAAETAQERPESPERRVRRCRSGSLRSKAAAYTKKRGGQAYAFGGSSMIRDAFDRVIDRYSHDRMSLLDNHSGFLGRVVCGKRRLGLPVYLKTKLAGVRLPALRKQFLRGLLRVKFVA